MTRSVGLGLVPENLQSAYGQATTRAEFAALGVALYETVTGRTIAGRMTFSDTNDINVQKMGYLGVVTGVGGGNFNPSGNLNREQAAVMLSRLANVIGQPLPPSAPTFADNAQISSWALDSVGQIQATGIMGGVGNNQFAPQGDYTREQSIITILRLYEMVR
ncbi:MAG: S-layer homology domain-containing protein [Defluviitaleaceae bacterium]|nr:S-layer homology domain-containing protein [Defluviitaleaceae bacterium]